MLTSMLLNIVILSHRKQVIPCIKCTIELGVLNLQKYDLRLTIKVISYTARWWSISSTMNPWIMQTFIHFLRLMATTSWLTIMSSKMSCQINFVAKMPATTLIRALKRFFSCVCTLMSLKRICPFESLSTTLPRTN